VAVVLALAGYAYRLELLLALAPVVNDVRHPIALHRSVSWQQGPARPTAPPNGRPPNIVLILADDLPSTTSPCSAWRPCPTARRPRRTSIR